MFRVERTLIVALLFGIGCSKTTTPVAVDTNAAKEQRPAMSQTATPTETVTKSPEEMMEMMKKLSMPGMEQAALKPYAGTWTVTAKMWMTPESEPKLSKGTSVSKMILGNRYLEQKYTCKEKGEMFEGQGVLGFDNTTKMYVSTWIDNMSTGVYSEQGMTDPATKMIMTKGKMMDPATGKELAIRSTMTPVDKGSYTYTMYSTDPAGKEFKMMELVYTKPGMKITK